MKSPIDEIARERSLNRLTAANDDLDELKFLELELLYTLVEHADFGETELWDIVPNLDEVCTCNAGEGWHAAMSDTTLRRAMREVRRSIISPQLFLKVYSFDEQSLRTRLRGTNESIL